MRQHDLRRSRSRFRRHKHEADPAHDVCMFRRTHASRHPRLRSETVIAVQVRYCCPGLPSEPLASPPTNPVSQWDTGFSGLQRKVVDSFCVCFFRRQPPSPQATVVRESRVRERSITPAQAIALSPQQPSINQRTPNPIRGSAARNPNLSPARPSFGSAPSGEPGARGRSPGGSGSAEAIHPCSRNGPGTIRLG